MSENACLVLLLDAPLQAWGLVNTFSNRGTALFPTKGSIIGMICAAMGLGKGSADEREWLPKLAGLILTTVAIPRSAPSSSEKLKRAPTDANSSPGATATPMESPGRSRAMGRLNDFHTVLGTRRASGKIAPYPVLTQRQYLEDARFGAFLTGELAVLQRVQAALRHPVWGIWLGRKCCVPSSRVCIGVAPDLAHAWNELKKAAEMAEGREIHGIHYGGRSGRFRAGNRYAERPAVELRLG